MNKFRKLITITVTLVTTVLLLNFLALFYIREKSKVKASWEDVVNISWNQQAAGQQMLKDIMLLKSPKASAEAKFKTEFKDNVESFSIRQESLQTILNTDLAKEPGLGDVQGLVTAAKPLHSQLLGLANQALNGTSPISPAENAFSDIANQTDYFEKMASIRYQAAKHKNLVDTRIFQISLLIPISLSLALIILALLVITPVFRRGIKDYQQLMIAKDELEEKSNAKSDFLSNISHELRTPMNGIIGFTDLVLTTELKNSQREHLTYVRKSADALLNIMNNILDFSKIESGKLVIERHPLKLEEIIKETVSILMVKAMEKNLQVTLNFDPALRSQFSGDPVRIKQVIINLLGNAIKFTHEGRITIDVRPKGEPYTKGQKKFTDAEISITDTGIGIAPEQLKKIFEGFTQGDSTAGRAYNGTGLGLSISRKLVELMSGKMDVQSEAGKGSTFKFFLPLEVIDEVVTVGNTSRLSLGTALIVDDNVTNCNLMKGIFEFLNIPCEICYSGYEAIEAVIEAQENNRMFDLIITDHKMPEMDGITLAKEIQQVLRGTAEPYIILLSSLERDQYGNLEEAGINKFLSKPVKLQELSEVLSTIFETPETKVAPDPEPIKPIPTVAEPLKILVAEDNPMNMMLIAEVLRKMGLTITKASSGEEALDLAAQQKPDLIFMDIHMPGMDGYTAARTIRSWPSPDGTIPIIALTANAMKEDRERALAAGMNGFITKPFRVSDIELVIETHLKEQLLDRTLDQLGDIKL
ncbi:response regulator [Daejeonella lutea]|uniref:histidine kinase n=1 Tax=Daejeonella lutea TaxID=572036 RepID=A0A1T5CY38_9SPHI|nr:response regulator [Daejeonella lutea]SKB64374.1 Signal transduction histidine kinase [Daejeonella lutea]